jgi:hypothetical protein
MLPGATEPFNRVSYFQIARSMVSRSYLLALLMVVLSCNKKPDVQEDGYVYISGSGLGGKWLAKEKYVSAGGGPIPVNLPREQWFTMEFKSDSSFTYSANFPKTDSLFSQYSLSGFYINVTSTVILTLACFVALKVVLTGGGVSGSRVIEPALFFQQQVSVLPVFLFYW